MRRRKAAIHGCYRNTRQWLRGSEIGGEGGVDLVATSEGAVDYADAVDLGLDALDTVGLAVDVLFEDVADALAVDVEAGDELLSATERSAVVDGDAADHHVDALLVEVFEADAHTLSLPRLSSTTTSLVIICSMPAQL